MKKNSAKLLSLTDFQNSCGLDDKSLLWLIKNNKLEIEYDESTGISVNCASINNKVMIESILQSQMSQLQSQKELIKEKISVILEDQLEKLLDETLLS